MNLYLFVKFIHIVSSTILFGTGLGTASVMFYGHNTRNVSIIAAVTRYVVFADWIFTTPSAFMQLMTGFWLVYLAGFSLYSFWIWGSICGYVIAMCCWLPVLFLQIKMRDFAIHASVTQTKLHKDYYRYYNYWFFLGWPAFISLIIVFYLMTNKPVAI